MIKPNSNSKAYNQACNIQFMGEIMDEKRLELLRKYGYDILINRFEPLLRRTIINEVLLINYGYKNWLDEIPKGVIHSLEEEKETDFKNLDIEDFFEELYLWSLKEIAIYSDHYNYLKCLTKDLSKQKFIELMDELNEIRKKIAHAKSNFSKLDLIMVKENTMQICQGEIGEEFINYVNNESYKTADEIPPSFLTEEYSCPNNLPIEHYDLDGGFVGRKKEIVKIKKLLYSDQDRIVTVTGAGGIGKTAVALKTTYSILADEKNNSVDEEEMVISRDEFDNIEKKEIDKKGILGKILGKKKDNDDWKEMPSKKSKINKKESEIGSVEECIIKLEKLEAKLELVAGYKESLNEMISRLSEEIGGLDLWFLTESGLLIRLKMNSTK